MLTTQSLLPNGYSTIPSRRWVDLVNFAESSSAKVMGPITVGQVASWSSLAMMFVLCDLFAYSGGEQVCVCVCVCVCFFICIYFQNYSLFFEYKFYYFLFLLCYVSDDLFLCFNYLNYFLFYVLLCFISCFSWSYFYRYLSSFHAFPSLLTKTSSLISCFANPWVFFKASF